MPSIRDAQELAGYLGVTESAGYKYLRAGCPLSHAGARTWLAEREHQSKISTTKAGRERRQHAAISGALAARSDLDRILFDWVRHG